VGGDQIKELDISGAARRGVAQMLVVSTIATAQQQSPQPE